MKYLLVGLVLLGVVLVGGAAYVLFVSKRVPPSDYAWTTVQVRDTVFRARIADTIAKQVRGLSGYPQLAADEGMLFIFATSSPRIFWMKEMNFPIDIIWVRSGAVTGFAENAVPEPGVSDMNLKLYASPGGANWVLEAPAGTVKKYGIMAGDAVVVQ